MPPLSVGPSLRSPGRPPAGTLPPVWRPTLAVAISLFLGCSPTDPPPAAPAPAAAAPAPLDAARVAALGARFEGGKTCDLEALGRLRSLRDEHGGAALREPLLVAYTACEAPGALADLLLETLSASPTDEEVAVLGAALIRASRYEEAANRLLPVAARSGQDDAVRWLTGFALLHAGRDDEAIPWLTAGQQHAGGQNGSEGPLLLGLAHLQGGDSAAAIPLLEDAVRRSPSDHSALSALSRALAAEGRVAEAQTLAARTQAAQDEAETLERARIQLAAMSMALTQAWEARNYAEAEQLVDRMWPLAPPPLRVTLQEYRVEVLANTGRPDEASSARAELARMRGGR